MRAFIFSLHGVRTAFKSEAAFRQECAFAIVLVPVAVWLGRTGVERAILAGTCLIVLIVELLNTAVEYVVDRIGAEHHELSGKAKDCGSAAVLMSLVLAAVVWTLVAWDRFVAS